MYAHNDTTNLIFFQTIKKHRDPVKNGKLNSKTFLQNTFFDFLSRFVRFCLQSLQKCKYDLTFFKKRIISRRFQIRWKSLKEVHCLKNMSKNGKRTYFRHVLLIAFFVQVFTTYTYLKSAWNSMFFKLILNFAIKVFCLYYHFIETSKANAYESAQKIKTVLYKRVLEVKFATIAEVGEPSC